MRNYFARIKKRNNENAERVGNIISASYIYIIEFVKKMFVGIILSLFSKKYWNVLMNALVDAFKFSSFINYSLPD